MKRVLPLLLAACTSIAQADAPALLQALITDERLNEISGIAASRQHDGVFWVHNDGDNPAELHAIDREGTLRATLRISGVRNVDWEDLAAFDLDGHHYLAIADVGDNGGLRRDLRVLIVEEPAELRDTQRPPTWKVRFRWPDGARDSEAMAIDERERAIYVVSKKRVPPELFRLPLDPGTGGVIEAERVATLGGIEQPTDADLRRNPVYGRYRAQITAADISPDGERFAVLNYRRVYVWSRRGRDWPATLSETPQVIQFPWIPQAEALAFDPRDGSLWISSERLPAPLLRLPREQLSR
jgi:hypothetical protein